MTLLTFSLFLGGIIAASIPLILHFLMKGKPKRIEFPALCFVRRKFEVNRKRFTLKHILLMILRAGFLFLLGLTLARPFLKVSGEAGGTLAGLSRSGEPVAAVIVVDTSIRMGYQVNNQTRLSQAIRTALQIIDDLPLESQIAILDSTTGHDSFQIDRLAARKLAESLIPVPHGRPVCESVQEAVRILTTSSLERREVFVLTDRTQPGWLEPEMKSLKTMVQKAQSQGTEKETAITFYLADFGQDEIDNASILETGLSSETVSAGTTVRFDVDLFHSGTARESIVELCLIRFPEEKTGNNSVSTAPGEKTADGFLSVFSIEQKLKDSVSFPEGESKREVVFHLSDLSPGLHQGFIRFTEDDPLSADNIRWFTVDVRESWKVLLVAEEPVDDHAIFVREALAPEEYRQTGLAPFEVDTVSFDKFQKMSTETMFSYRAILLLDPIAFDGKIWRDLSDYVAGGGGLGVFLGRNASPVSNFQTPEVTSLLGGRITVQVRVPEQDQWMLPLDYENPVLASFRSFARGNEIPWSTLPVGRFWQITDLAKTSQIILRYSGGQPAVLSHSSGQGNVVVCTTPVSDLPDNNPWNLFPVGENSWIFVVFMDGLTRSLIRGGGSLLNYLTGEQVVLRPVPQQFPPVTVLTFPDQKEIRLSSDLQRRQITFPGTEQTGPYRLRSLSDKVEEKIDCGFTVNLLPSETDLKRMDDSQWESLWGGLEHHRLEERLDIERIRIRQRTGAEIFPVLLMLLMMVFLAEFIVANRFYR